VVLVCCYTVLSLADVGAPQRFGWFYIQRVPDDRARVAVVGFGPSGALSGRPLFCYGVIRAGTGRPSWGRNLMGAHNL